MMLLTDTKCPLSCWLLASNLHTAVATSKKKSFTRCPTFLRTQQQHGRNINFFQENKKRKVPPTPESESRQKCENLTEKNFLSGTHAWSWSIRYTRTEIFNYSNTFVFVIGHNIWIFGCCFLFLKGKWNLPPVSMSCRNFLGINGN